jgi:hypothetical protein
MGNDSNEEISCPLCDKKIDEEMKKDYIIVWLAVVIVDGVDMFQNVHLLMRLFIAPNVIP